MSHTSTLHEHWYRIRDLKITLSTVATVSRQRYRGQIWYVVSSSIQNKYYRLNSGAYRVVALLDGERSIDKVWHMVMSADPYNAPAQGEVIQVLSQLFSAGLIAGSIPPDTGAILRSVEKAEWQGRKAFIGGLLFPKIPLYDPDYILEKLSIFIAPFISWFGALLWLVLVVVAGWSLAGNAEELGRQSASVLTPANLPWLYVSIVFVKLLHEGGHAFCCKIIGKREGEGTEVHTLGVMLLVFSPLPYVDVSSAWMLKKRVDRALVGLGGVLVEVGVAALAALIWVRVEPSSPVHTIAYNIIFASGVSTVIFNGNPLLRYDGYYVMCDLLNMPNLATRANATLKNLLKRIFFGVKTEQQLTYNRVEKVFFPFYSLAALCYRFVVLAGISMYIAEQLFIVGVLVAISGVLALFVKPLYGLLKYTLYSMELRGRRRRAIVTTFFGALSVFTLIGVMPFSDYDRIEGVVEPVNSQSIRAGTEGVMQNYIKDSVIFTPSEIAILSNPEIESKLERIRAEYEVGVYQSKQALVESPLAYQIAQEQQEALKVGILHAEDKLAGLVIKTSNSGIWLPADSILIQGAFLKKGQQVGTLIGKGGLQVRCVATQDTSAAIMNEGSPDVEVRLKKSPELCFKGKVCSVSLVGTKELPSILLGDVAGGEILTTLNRKNQRMSQERIFEIVIQFDEEALSKKVFSGQTVVARIKIKDKPLLTQLWDGLLQIFQRKYQI